MVKSSVSLFPRVALKPAATDPVHVGGDSGKTVCARAADCSTRPSVNHAATWANRRRRQQSERDDAVSPFTVVSRALISDGIQRGSDRRDHFAGPEASPGGAL